ncbi:MAG: UDP-N-acetylmuramoyl-tripeptide--D-alanyl-D-alanine ligase [Solirubrobacterales bacterium]
MKLTGEQIAAATGATILAAGPAERPVRATIASGETGPGDLFFGLPGASRDGGEYALAALEAGAWGVLARPEHAQAAAAPNTAAAPGTGTRQSFSPDSVRNDCHAWVLGAEDPLAALQALAREQRRALGVRVVGVTGSVGKTSVKDITRALLPGRVHANRENLNTEIGLPLTILEAPDETELMVLEMAMRGAGQIAELAAIAEPDVAVITNVGPVHIELLGSVAAVAAAKAEILDALPAGGVAVAPVQAGELEPHLRREDLRILRFGPGGDVEARQVRRREGVTEAEIATPLGSQLFHFPFTEAHNLTNALAAVAAGVGLGIEPAVLADGAASIGFSRFRGERLELGEGIVLVNDCYNANPVSMRAALDHLVSLGAPRTVAVLGEMGELGEGAPAYHREVGEHARAAGVDVVIGVGEPARGYDPDELVADPGEAAELLAARLEAGDAVLVKGSRSVGMEQVAELLVELV